ncbi:hypothetical protein E2562_000530 [Oryza meyeriana var. granulata]|uniref:Uncharacterized protein n=1 Tax=Oryza meyeriana var. granulata TaxID=110450 RepID=A0A6G1DSS8_9ORYZ|nr:hypothetical protein E2562_000530 [Oryza meyeriana var. granulata]
METMSYPCSPLLSFPAHEESSYFIWSSQAALHANASLHVDPCSDQQEELDFLDTMVLDSSELHQHDAPDVDVSINCDGRILGQENGNLVAIQEELLEEDSLSDLLLAGVEAVEAGDSILSSVAFSRLDDFLSGIPANGAASSFDRLAYHFDQGLRSRMSSACTGCYQPEPLPSGNNMLVYQIMQELSPFVKFAHFTSNQAILDTTVGDMNVHVVDLNIGEGVQWSSLMSDLARRGGKSFRLTAITRYADYNDSTQDSAVHLLSEFAESLKLPFQYNSICMHNEEELHALSKECKGSVIMSCDTTCMYYKSLSTLQDVLLVCVKKLQPKLVVIVEEDLVRIGRGASPSSTSFGDFFFEALHHFTMVFESLASCFSGGNYEACLRIVEMDLVGPRIQDFVGKYGSVRVEANASEVLEGFRASQSYSKHTRKEDDRTRLERILLRMHSVVEKAEGHHITNQGMLLQLKGLMEGLYLGYYMLDKIKFQPPEEEIIEDEDERVRNFFSHIFFFKEDDLKIRELSLNFKTSQGKYLFVIEFIWDVDEAAWTKFQSYLQNMAGTGIKVVVIGRTENIAKFGTTQPIRVKRMSEEKYWYYFKALAFGSMDPDEHPKLASLGMQLAAEMKGGFLGATVYGELLRANPNTQFWQTILLSLREIAQKHLSSFGVHPADLFHRKIPVDFPRVAFVGTQVQRCLVYDLRVAGSGQSELPKITSQDVIMGADIPVEDKFEVLVWRSRIPPYCDYIVNYKKQKALCMVGRRNHLALRKYKKKS